MKIEDIRKMSNEELHDKIKSTKDELFTKRMQLANGTLEKSTDIKALRKDVARMKTVLSEREDKDGRK